MLKKGDFELYGARGESIQVEAIGTYMLKLPYEKILELENCYYMPKIIKNIISILLLLQRGYEINRKSNSCSIFFSNEIICHGVINYGLLILSNDNVFHINESKKRKREEIGRAHV